ncbi:MAG: excinuclease ABC subunit UvrC [Armatimonadetes bacterium]|nr:excinuclease ABC subunit UvrC [Armatimonadota bacterium]
MRTALEAVSNKLRALPAKPGCYIYRDEQGSILYVGKAVSLKSRVRSYFQKSTIHGIRIARMVSKVRDLEWIVVDSELEALVLECNLIKEHRPPFNVRLRDDKSYPYIVITEEPYPRVMFTRKLRKDGSKYFGPYSNAGSVRETLGLLHKVFKLIPCGKSWTGEPVQRPCLYYHMGQCLAPCAGLAEPKEYAKEIESVRLFLDGRQDKLVKDMKARMLEASKNLDYEAAARVRDAITSIESVLERQKVVASGQKDQDVVAVVKDDRGAAVQMFYVRGGKLIGQRHFYLEGAADTNPGEAVEEFVKRYYTDAPEIPREVLLPVEIEERNIVQTWLRQKRGAAVTVEVPKGGEKLKLVELAAMNAELALQQMQQEQSALEEWAAAASAQLQETLGLDAPPHRIECYDISNIQGTSPVGSMVVFEGGAPAKDQYRRFKIKYNPESPDDFAMMRETILRRLRAYKDGSEKFQKLPDLMVIDGGRGQLGAALKAMSEVGLYLPAIGLAKKHELIFQASEPPLRQSGGREGAGGGEFPCQAPPDYWSVDQAQTDPNPVELPMNSPGLLLIRRLRDEAHRFALSYHRKLRDKRMFGSPLDEIVGVGPRRRRLLLRTFGSVQNIRRATVEEIASVPTMTASIAKRVKDALEE